MSFQSGYIKMFSHYGKQYHPYLSQNGILRYAGKGRIHFRTATQALVYAQKWALRADRLVQKVGPA